MIERDSEAVRAEDAGEVAAGTDERTARVASRRGFLSRSAAAASGIVLAGASAAQARGPAKRSTSTSGVNANAVPVGGRAIPALYPGWNYRNFNEIMNDENAHVAYLLQALGSAARPMPTFQGLVASTDDQFVNLSLTFENTGVHAYLGALPSIYNHAYTGAAGTIATVEARHAGYLNTLLNMPIVPTGAFDTPYSQAQVIAAVAPFVVSLNGGPPLGFSTTNLGPANDVAILNFALALEFLERQFYNTNVPRIF